MGIRVLLCCFLLQNTDYKNSLLFTPFSATRFAMHRIYANRINSRSMSRVFCDLRSQKTPRGILPVNSNILITLKPKLFQIIQSQSGGLIHESIRTLIILCKSIHSKQ